MFDHDDDDDNSHIVLVESTHGDHGKENEQDEGNDDGSDDYIDDDIGGDGDEDHADDDVDGDNRDGRLASSVRVRARRSCSHIECRPGDAQKVHLLQALMWTSRSKRRV